MDRSLGGLARWLRLLGLDAAYAPAMEDAELLRLAGLGRLVITRTRAVAEKLGPGRFFWVRENDPKRQLAELGRALGLSVRPGAAFTRCLLCNLPVAPMDREEAAGLVPDHVFQNAPAFFRCPGCGRVFWPGTHRDRALALAKKLLGGAF